MFRKASMSEADTRRTSGEEFWSKMDQKGDALTSAQYAPRKEQLRPSGAVLKLIELIEAHKVTSGGPSVEQ